MTNNTLGFAGVSEELQNLKNQIHAASASLNKKTIHNAQSNSATEVERLHAELFQTREALSQLRKAQGKLTEESASQIAELTAAHAELTQAHNALTKERNEQSKLAEQRATQIAELTAAQAQLTNTHTELKSSHTELTKSHAELNRTHTELLQTKATLTEQLNSQTKLAEQRATQIAELTATHAQLTQAHTEITQTKAALTKFEAATKKEFQNTVRQIEDYLRVQASLAGAPVLPSMHGWPISPDFAMLLVTLIRRENYTAIIEFGSGTSTVLMAQTALNAAGTTPKRPPPKYIAFEHLEKFHTKTLADLRDGGVPQNFVNVCYSPLVPFQDSTGSYNYYNCASELHNLGAQIEKSQTPAKILVVIDGPPGSTNKHARYPAFPVVIEHFPNSTIHFLLDDYIRDDEKQIAALWKTALQQQNREFTETVYNFEKEGLLLTVMGNTKTAKSKPHKGV